MFVREHGLVRTEWILNDTGNIHNCLLLNYSRYIPYIYTQQASLPVVQYFGQGNSGSWLYWKSSWNFSGYLFWLFVDYKINRLHKNLWLEIECYKLGHNKAFYNSVKTIMTSILSHVPWLICGLYCTHLCIYSSVILYKYIIIPYGIFVH